MKLDNSFFCITPEALKAVNVNLASGKSLLMIKPQMPVSTKHQSIIASEFISIHNRTPSYSFHRHRQKRFSRNILDNFNQNSPVSLENSEYRNLIISPSASLSFTSSSKIRFIKFYLAIQKILCLLGIGYNSNPDNGNSFKNRWIAQLNLLGYLSGRYLKFKQLYYPKPLFIRYFNPVKPSASKVMKLISTALTAVPFIRNSVGFIAPTRYAKNIAIFPAIFSKIKPCSIFCFTEVFKCI